MRWFEFGKNDVSFERMSSQSERHSGQVLIENGALYYSIAVLSDLE